MRTVRPEKRMRPKRSWRWGGVVLFANAMMLGGAASAQEAGTYVREGNTGVLVVKPSSDGTASFKIVSYGSGLHTCEIEGPLRERRGTVPTARGECEITFEPATGGIKVEAAEEGKEACAGFCGAGADFDGVYLSEDETCTPKERSKARSRFKRLFDKKAYAEARELLQPVLESCSATMAQDEQYWFRNDLAFTLARLGEKQACLDMLEPLIGDSNSSDDELREKYGPVWADTFVRLKKATLANLKACRRLVEPRTK